MEGDEGRGRYPSYSGSDCRSFIWILSNKHWSLSFFSPAACEIYPFLDGKFFIEVNIIDQASCYYYKDLQC
jgi:hypothetical protein